MYTWDKDDLRREDGTVTFGVTDNRQMCIYVYAGLSDYMREKVLTHELVHAWIYSYGIMLSVQQEEMICSFIDTYGRSIIAQADQLLHGSSSTTAAK